MSKLTAHDFGMPTGDVTFAAVKLFHLLEGIDKLRAQVASGQVLVQRVSVTSTAADGDFVRTHLTFNVVEKRDAS